MLRFFIMPFGRRRRGPSDRLIRTVSELLTEPSAARDRLIGGIYIGDGEEAVGKLTRTFEMVAENQTIRDRLREAGISDSRVAREKGLIDEAEARRLEAEERAIDEVIAVDDFAPEALTGDAARPASREAAE
jgi:acyl-CoA dehydrogenase